MSDTSIPTPVTEVLDAASSWLPARMGEVESRLATLAGGYGAALAHEAVETLNAGGKRMRPLLVLLSAGPDADEGAVSAATAVEMVHMATLVHDDVLDAAPLRRGRPTVYARSGRKRAVATGDLILSRAFAELCRDPANAHRIQILSRASVSLALGELAQRHDAFDLSVTAERYLERCALKTASLFECACTIGRPPAEPGRPEPLLAYGSEIGLAFQLLDDVLDVVGPPERTGKARGTDLLDGTVNLPLIRAIELDPSLADLDLHNLDPDEAVAVCDRIAALGAADEVRDAAKGRIDLAKARLRDTTLGPGEIELLDMVADGVVERYA